MRRYADHDWQADPVNLLIISPTGGGKTYLASPWGSRPATTSTASPTSAWTTWHAGSSSPGRSIAHQQTAQRAVERGPPRHRRLPHRRHRQRRRQRPVRRPGQPRPPAAHHDRLPDRASPLGRRAARPGRRRLHREPAREPSHARSTSAASTCANSATTTPVPARRTGSSPRPPHGAGNQRAARPATKPVPARPNTGTRSLDYRYQLALRVSGGHAK